MLLFSSEFDVLTYIFFKNGRKLSPYIFRSRHTESSPVDDFFHFGKIWVFFVLCVQSCVRIFVQRTEDGERWIRFLGLWRWTRITSFHIHSHLHIECKTKWLWSSAAILRKINFIRFSSQVYIVRRYMAGPLHVIALLRFYAFSHAGALAKNPIRRMYADITAHRDR